MFDQHPFFFSRDRFRYKIVVVIMQSQHPLYLHLAISLQQGHVRKNWKIRRFVLLDTHLEYYRIEKVSPTDNEKHLVHFFFVSGQNQASGVHPSIRKQSINS